jgi:hypothetical protein
MLDTTEANKSQEEMFDHCHFEVVTHSCNSCYKLETHLLQVAQRELVS